MLRKLVKPSVGRRGINVLRCSLSDICLQPVQWPLKENKWNVAGFWPPSSGPASADQLVQCRLADFLPTPLLILANEGEHTRGFPGEGVMKSETL